MCIATKFYCQACRSHDNRNNVCSTPYSCNTQITTQKKTNGCCKCAFEHLQWDCPYHAERLNPLQATAMQTRPRFTGSINDTPVFDSSDSDADDDDNGKDSDKSKDDEGDKDDVDGKDGDGQGPAEHKDAAGDDLPEGDLGDNEQASRGKSSPTGKSEAGPATGNAATAEYVDPRPSWIKDPPFVQRTFNPATGMIWKRVELEPTHPEPMMFKMDEDIEEEERKRQEKMRKH